MATYTSIIQPKGTIGDTVFRKQGNTQVIYLKPHFSYERWKQDPRYLRSRENAMEFGGASKCAAILYRQFAKNHSKWLRPLAHNAIASALRSHLPRKGRTAASFNFIDHHRNLIGLELGHQDSIGRSLEVKLVGTNHAPDHCRIENLRQIADTLDPHGLLGLQCRIIRRNASFVDCSFNPSTSTWETHALDTSSADKQYDTGWFAAEHIPQEAIRLSLGSPKSFLEDQAKHEAQLPMLSILIVQWRTTSGPRPRPLYHQSTARVIAAIMPLATAKQLAATKSLQPKPGRRISHEQQPINPQITKTMLQARILGSPP